MIWSRLVDCPVEAPRSVHLEGGQREKGCFSGAMVAGAVQVALCLQLHCRLSIIWPLVAAHSQLPLNLLQTTCD